MSANHAAQLAQEHGWPMRHIPPMQPHAYPTAASPAATAAGPFTAGPPTTGPSNKYQATPSPAPARYGASPPDVGSQPTQPPGISQPVVDTPATAGPPRTTGPPSYQPDRYHAPACGPVMHGGRGRGRALPVGSHPTHAPGKSQPFSSASRPPAIGIGIGITSY
jgi:hypothetical protein